MPRFAPRFALPQAFPYVCASQQITWNVRAMRLSRYFLPLLKETPSEAQIVSHRLMLRAGLVRQEAAGIYAWLPLGFRVLKKIEQIVREEMNRAGAIEILMPTLQPSDLWKETGRYDAYGPEMLRIKDRHDREMLYGPTNEDMVTEIFRAYVRSYKALPLNLYHIQWKFRDEVRPRFGVMRGREFLMKDAYSFDLNEENARKSYNRMYVAYLRTFTRMGLKTIPMRAETGPIGGDLSHEFIVLAETGESQVYCHKDLLDMPVPGEDVDFDSDLSPIVQQRTSLYAATSDVHDQARFEAEVPEDKRVSARGIEVGQVFFFGDKYSKPMKAVVTGPDGKDVAVQGGSYGIGVSRLVGAIIEAFHDEGGIIWPEPVAPFDIVLINLKAGDAKVDAACEDLYAKLTAAGKDVLYDDTNDRPGAKFASADLIGIPWQLVIGPRGLENGIAEVKNRATGAKEEMSLDAVVNRFAKR
jgi:prolyl-tRNA synthetase